MSFLFGLKAAQAKNRARAPGVNETRWLERRGRRGSAQVLRLPVWGRGHGYQSGGIPGICGGVFPKNDFGLSQTPERHLGPQSKQQWPGRDMTSYACVS